MKTGGATWFVVRRPNVSACDLQVGQLGKVLPTIPSVSAGTMIPHMLHWSTTGSRAKLYFEGKKGVRWLCPQYFE